MKISKSFFYSLAVICLFTTSLRAKTIFSPNGDGINDTTVFKLQIGTSKENIGRWLFEIKDSNGELIRKFEGDGSPPDKLSWDGKNENQFLVSDGLYTYVFSIVTNAGNKVRHPSQDIIVDRSVPDASISVDLDIFSPNGDGVKDETTFSLKGFDINGINSWLLTIENKDNIAVKSFSEVGDVKASLIWDGKGDFGEDVSDGTYSYYLIIQDNAGNRFRTKTKKIRLNREAKVSTIEVDLFIFSPNGDGIKDAINIKTSVADISLIESWKLSILNPVGRVSKSFAGKGPPPQMITWDGKSNKEKVVADGTYKLVLSETDNAGNTVSTVPVPVEVDNSPPICRIGLDNKLFSPNNDNVLEKATFSLKITDTHTLEWKLFIADDVGKSVRTFAGKGKNPEENLVWDGMDDRKKSVIDGSFTYFLEAKDIAGNIHRTPEEPVQIDTTPPVIHAEASPALFSPNRDGIMDEENFILHVQDASPLERWELEIKNSSGKTVKIFKGKESVKRDIAWDGKNDNKETLPDGTYRWTIEALDVAGNSSRTTPEKIVIGATKPTITVKSDLDIFSPNADGFKDSVQFSIEVSAFNKVKDWNLRIAGAGGGIKHTFSGREDPPGTISWLGEKDDKKPLQDGKYSYTLEVNDEAGNHVFTPPKSIIIDTAKPHIQVRVAPDIFSPNNDGFKDEISFTLSYDDESPADHWKLAIENGEKRVLKEFSGSENPPITIIWDGKDTDGDIVKDGIYNYILSARDIVGNQVVTFRQTLRIDNTSPEVRLSADLTLFSPNDDGEKDTTVFFLEYKDSSDISDWKLTATGPEPALRTFKGTGRPSRNITWDGKNDRGNVLSDGVYNAVLSVKDEVGNEGKSHPIQITIDTSKPVVTIVTEEKPIQALVPQRSFSETERGVVISLAAEVLFDVGASELKSGARTTLDKVINIIKRYPNRRISVEGHTDNIPINTSQFSNNQVLSEERAKSVLRFFVNKLNLPTDRFTTKGFGETQPIAPNTTEDGQKKNRRVEIILLK